MWSSKTSWSKRHLTYWKRTHQGKILDLSHSLVKTATERSSLKTFLRSIPQKIILLLQNILPLRSSYAQNVQTGYHGDLRKMRHVIQINQLKYMTSGIKNSKKYIFATFWSGFFRIEDKTLQQCIFLVFTCLTPIFQGQSNLDW